MDVRSLPRCLCRSRAAASLSLSIVLMPALQAADLLPGDVQESSASVVPADDAAAFDPYLELLDREAASDPLLEMVSYSFKQDTVPLQPLPVEPLAPTAPTTASASQMASIFRGDAPRSDLNTTAPPPRETIAADRVLGIESKARSTSDVGSLLSRSSRNQGVVAQKRSPIITDPRIRGSRVGQLGASGSYWVPARIDLDTMLSKLDSQLIESVDVVKGPYAAEYGPGFEFFHFTLLSSPRSEDGTQVGGSSGATFQTNGEQWYGRQTFHIAAEDYGVRLGYGHRTGSDYKSGDGTGIPSSYESRDLDLALGFDLTEDQSLELFFLHQDQTDVELPGQAFDLDSSRTNAFEATWIHRDIGWADQLEIEGWYNETRLKGNAQNPSKRRTFPILDVINYTGTTDVESASTGARAQAVWEIDDGRALKAGVDVRVVRQELDEISSGQFGFVVFNNANSPIPRSLSANPGLFVELTDDTIDGLHLRAGARTDVVTSEVIDDAARLQNLSTGLTPLSIEDILGTGELDQSFGLWSAYLAADYELDDHWTLKAAAGHGQRPPSLTEMYAAESFMFLLQSGLNTVTGDPRLDAERRWQVDLGAEYQDERFRARVNGFHAWIHDRITFEAMSTRLGPPLGQVEQVNLKYVNTDRATLAGFETDGEYFIYPWLSVFGSASYVEGRDLTRNGDFATLQADGVTGAPSVRVPGAQRGDFSGLNDNTAGGGAGKEPLPGIPPLEGRFGVRVHGTLNDGLWNLELAARAVDQQDRVARSLNETTTDGYTVLDLRGYWQVNEHLNVLAGVENLTDKQYREHFDFRTPSGLSIAQPGINFYFGSELVY